MPAVRGQGVRGDRKSAAKMNCGHVVQFAAPAPVRGEALWCCRCAGYMTVILVSIIVREAEDTSEQLTLVIEDSPDWSIQ